MENKEKEKGNMEFGNKNSAFTCRIFIAELYCHSECIHRLAEEPRDLSPVLSSRTLIRDPEFLLQIPRLQFTLSEVEWARNDTAILTVFCYRLSVIGCWCYYGTYGPKAGTTFFD